MHAKASKPTKRKRSPNKRPSPLLKFSLSEVEDALERALASYSEAARILEDEAGKTCSHVTVGNYVRRHASLRHLVEEIKTARSSQVMAAIEQAEGYLSDAADILTRMTGKKWSHTTVESYIRRRPKVKRHYEEVRYRKDDEIEKRFIEHALKGNEKSLWKLMSTRLRHRGYGERQISDGGLDATEALRDMLKRSGEAIDRAEPGKPNGSAEADAPYDRGEIA